MAGSSNRGGSSRRSASDKVTLRLAHPLSAEQARRLGVDTDEPLNVGDDVQVDQAQARSIIGSGYAQVDPEDPVAVSEALGVAVPGVEPSGARGATTNTES